MINGPDGLQLPMRCPACSALADAKCETYQRPGRAAALSATYDCGANLFTQMLPQPIGATAVVIAGCKTSLKKWAQL